MGFWDVPWSSFEGAECQSILRESLPGVHLTSWAPGVDPIILDPGEEIDLWYWFKLGGETAVTDPLPQLAQGDKITLHFHYTMLPAGAGGAAASAPCLTADLP